MGAVPADKNLDWGCSQYACTLVIPAQAPSPLEKPEGLDPSSG